MKRSADFTVWRRMYSLGTRSGLASDLDEKPGARLDPSFSPASRSFPASRLPLEEEFSVWVDILGGGAQLIQLGVVPAPL